MWRMVVLLVLAAACAGDAGDEADDQDSIPIGPGTLPSALESRDTPHSPPPLIADSVIVDTMRAPSGATRP